MAELPFFPLATDAWVADCEHLEDAEVGRYMRILIALWRAPSQRLPNDDEWLARKFRRPAEAVVAELRPLIKEFCQCDGNWITQKRVSKEYKRAVKAINQRRDAANARWLKEKEVSERNAASYGSRNALTPTLIPTPIQDSESPKTSTDPPRDAALVASGSAPRGKVLTMKERMAAIAERDRLKFAGNA
jgi:uncharacterized protein YdaU (DUF1376 family)